jgi:hypothetical protein
VWDDVDGFLQPKVEAVLAQMAPGGTVHAAVHPVSAALRALGR